MTDLKSASENNDAGGFPGVRSLFGKRGFPGTLKLSRHARTNDSENTKHTSSIDTQQASTSSIEQGMNTISVTDKETPQHVETTPPPKNSSQTTSNPNTPSTAPNSPPPVPVSTLRSMSEPRLAKYNRILDEHVVDLDALREISWSGIPPKLRPICWQLLLGYLPPNKDRRDQILARKRREYRELVPEYYDSASSMSAANNNNNNNSPGNNASGFHHSNNRAAGAHHHNTAAMSMAHTTLRANDDESALRQVSVDVPRTAPGVAFFHQPRMHKSLERILFIWGVRHPASGYVQGINDLVTPFLAVFLSESFDGPIEEWNLDLMSDAKLLDVEADCYWCLCKLLDGIQDHYTYAQPGIQKTLFHVRELVARVESSTAAHLDQEGVEFMQFAFRWVNCLLLRELPFELGIRIWDTYLAEGPGLKEFLVYLLSSFLLTWAPEIRMMEFQDLIMFLQKTPTENWTESDIEVVLSRAYMWRASFKDASSHFS